MKVVHICISNPYIDGWGYQENLLPKYMAMSGDDVYVIATYNGLPKYLGDDVRKEIHKKGKKYFFDGINLQRIYVIPISESLVIPFGLIKAITSINPDVIFHHNVNPFSLAASVLAKNRNCRLFVDNHADEINCSKKWFWRTFYYKFFVRVSCLVVSKYVTKFFGVTHSRCAFLHDYFGISYKKIEFLPIGADTILADTIDSKSTLRKKYGFHENDKIVVSGGKMGMDKGTDVLIDAVASMNNNGRNIKLVLFGKFEDYKTENLSGKFSFVRSFGWCDRLTSLELLRIGDVACWPVHHTTLCEDSIAVCTPLILRKTETTCHLIDGNGRWIENEKLECVLSDFFDEESKMLFLKCKQMRNAMSYECIIRLIYGFV